ncbi:MAG: hypothetical protein M1827_005675 [Pycnora praestabilis]|nr:MAG: hypothetical protein M1827_005675 [Pycnora praestabilis]
MKGPRAFVACPAAFLLLISFAKAGRGGFYAIEKRERKCQFPKNAGLVAVSPGSVAAGWAMPPDQPCTRGMYCPYACPPGNLSAQWDPQATSYVKELSRHGGLYCDGNGIMQKPFPSKPYCVPGAGTVEVTNKAIANVAFCQTVLPGDEGQLIPTNVVHFAILAVPDPSYWAGTGASYYINFPGVSPEKACVWGSKDARRGNWAPYSIGTKMNEHGTTFASLNWNPIWFEKATPFRAERPNFGLRIECPSGACNGLSCEINPSIHAVNEVTGSTAVGAGGARFCTMAVSKGGKLNVVVFQVLLEGSTLAENTSVSASTAKVYSAVSTTLQFASPRTPN